VEKYGVKLTRSSPESGRQDWKVLSEVTVVRKEEQEEVRLVSRETESKGNGVSMVMLEDGVLVLVLVLLPVRVLLTLIVLVDDGRSSDAVVVTAADRRANASFSTVTMGLPATIPKNVTRTNSVAQRREANIKERNTVGLKERCGFRLPPSPPLTPPGRPEMSSPPFRSTTRPLAEEGEGRSLDTRDELMFIDPRT
jgi:hypothetical protein